MYLCSNLVYLRKKHNLTQKEVGEAIGTDLRNIGHYEKAFREPRLETLVSLAGLFEVSIDDLLTKDMRPTGSMLPRNIKYLRKKEGFDQREIGDLLGIKAPAISKYESGMILPSIEGLINLSEFFGITVDDLLKKDLEKEGI